jgi:flagellar biosynthesis regulator FlbT
MEGTSVYTKIEYPNAVETKKLVLTAQMNLLNSIKHMQFYKEFRKKEQMLKMKLKNDLLCIKKDVVKIVESYPEIRRLGPPEDESENRGESKSKSQKSDSEIKKDLELNEQLEEIMARLKAIDRK